MIPRQIQAEIVERLDQFPAVALLGPRQAGKTTLAEMIGEKRPSIYLDLENPSDRAKLADPVLYLSAHEEKLVILDEVQKIPELFQILRGLIDKGRKKGLRAGRFLLLGSASIELLKQSGESLAGRIVYIELFSINCLEVPQKYTDKLWLRGGFPDSFLASSEKNSVVWRNAFIKTYLERDIPQFGPRIPAETLRRFWTMLAHNQGELLNAANIARGLAIDGKTVARYLDLLVDLLLVRRLTPWHKNVGKRLVKSPKIHVRDSGITHALLGINHWEQLMSHPVVGMSWEAFVVENIISAAPNDAIASFYRTLAGAEIDLLLEMPNGELWVFEIKRSTSPKVSKGFYVACDDLSPAYCFVVYPGHEQYPVSKGVDAIGLQEICSILSVKKM